MRNMNLSCSIISSTTTIYIRNTYARQTVYIKGKETLGIEKKVNKGIHRAPSTYIYIYIHTINHMRWFFFSSIYSYMVQHIWKIYSYSTKKYDLIPPSFKNKTEEDENQSMFVYAEWRFSYKHKNVKISEFWLCILCKENNETWKHWDERGKPSVKNVKCSYVLFGLLIYFCLHTLKWR